MGRPQFMSRPPDEFGVYVDIDQASCIRRQLPACAIERFNDRFYSICVVDMHGCGTTVEDGCTRGTRR